MPGRGLRRAAGRDCGRGLHRLRGRTGRVTVATPPAPGKRFPAPAAPAAAAELGRRCRSWVRGCGPDGGPAGAVGSEIGRKVQHNAPLPCQVITLQAKRGRARNLAQRPGGRRGRGREKTAAVTPVPVVGCARSAAPTGIKSCLLTDGRSARAAARPGPRSGSGPYRQGGATTARWHPACPLTAALMLPEPTAPAETKIKDTESACPTDAPRPATKGVLDLATLTPEDGCEAASVSTAPDAQTGIRV